MNIKFLLMEEKKDLNISEKALVAKDSYHLAYRIYFRNILKSSILHT